MVRTLRITLIVTMVATLAFNPATACHYCGQSWTGYSSSYVSECGTSYYYPAESYYGGCCGGELIVEDGCNGCGCNSCGCASCGCSDCGDGGCGCGGCDGCGCESGGEIVSEGVPTYVESPEMMESSPRQEYIDAPSPPARMPSNANKPTDEMAPPSLPARPLPRESAPPVPPSADEPREDLFGEPAAPAEEESSMDDLFSAPSEESSQPAEPADDLFGSPAAEPSTPTAPPSEPAATEDLFGPVDEEAATPPPATPPQAEPSGSSFDDLFGPPPATDDAPPADEGETTPPADDDFFGSLERVLGEPGGLASSQLRRWVDDSGNYSCRGRLIRVLDGKVKLMKDNGRTTTVPLGRLSQRDLDFVHRQASAQQSQTVDQTAQADVFRAY